MDKLVILNLYGKTELILQRSLMRQLGEKLFHVLFDDKISNFSRSPDSLSVLRCSFCYLMYLLLYFLFIFPHLRHIPPHPLHHCSLHGIVLKQIWQTLLYKYGEDSVEYNFALYLFLDSHLRNIYASFIPAVWYPFWNEVVRIKHMEDVFKWNVLIICSLQLVQCLAAL